MSRKAKVRPGEPIREITDSNGRTRYRAVIDVSLPGEKRRQATSTHDTLEDARAHVAVTRAARVQGERVTRTSEARQARSEAETVKALCERWVKGRRDVRAVTREGYRNVLSPVRQQLGDVRVVDLTTQDVNGLVEWMLTEGGQRGKGVSARTVNAALGAFAQALDLAVGEGAIPRNVVRLVKRPREVKRDPQRWDAQQIATFRAHADQDEWAAAWRLSLCGLRRSEVLGLTWAAVDWTAGCVRIEQARVQVTPTESAVDEPKSAASRRVVPVEAMMPGTMALLRAMRLASPRSGDEDPVLVDAAGGEPRPEFYSRRFAALCRGAKVPVIRLHATRHSAADLLLSKGMPMVDVAALLGHTVDVLLDRYGRSTPGGVQSVAEAFAKAVSE